MTWACFLQNRGEKNLEVYHKGWNKVKWSNTKRWNITNREMGNSPIRLHGFRKMVLLLVPPIPGEAKKRREKKNPHNTRLCCLCNHHISFRKTWFGEDSLGLIQSHQRLTSVLKPLYYLWTQYGFNRAKNCQISWFSYRG